jgi:folate-binding protein YgfZ
MFASSLADFFPSLIAQRDADGRIHHFGNPEGELRSAVEGVVIADVSERSRVEISGADRAKFVGNLCTADIVKLEVGRGTEAFFLSAKGKILDYGHLFAGPESLHLELEPGRSAGMIAHLDRYLFRENVALQDRTPTTMQWHVTGSKAREFLEILLPGVECPANPLDHRSAVVDGTMVLLRRRDRSTRAGYDLLFESTALPTLAGGVMNGAASVGLRPIGELALETLRIEAGLPRLGREVTQDNLPQEIGRDQQAISFTKGCYIGQETVARLDAMGHVNKRLRGLIAPPGSPIDAGMSVFHADKSVGVVTSSADSIRLGQRLALAMIRVSADEGATVRVGENPSIEATVAALPFA